MLYVLGMETLVMLKRRLSRLWPHLDERTRRMVAASEAVQWGYGGISGVSRACGLSRVTIGKGIAELAAGPLPPVPFADRGRADRAW